MITTKLKNIVLILLASLMVTSCQGYKQAGGAGIGALAGGLLGSRFGGGEGKILTTAVGAIAGGLIGSTIGKSLDEHDKMMAEKTTHNALESTPSGKTAEWRNPDNGHSGSVTPIRTYQDRQGTYCREYTQTINVGGETQKAYGKACRKPDGHWEIVN
jgi:surface antigen